MQCVAEVNWALCRGKKGVAKVGLAANQNDAVTGLAIFIVSAAKSNRHNRRQYKAHWSSHSRVLRCPRGSHHRYQTSKGFSRRFASTILGWSPGSLEQ
jgi:hypothetical protein